MYLENQYLNIVESFESTYEVDAEALPESLTPSPVAIDLGDLNPLAISAQVATLSASSNVPEAPPEPLSFVVDLVQAPHNKEAIPSVPPSPLFLFIDLIEEADSIGTQRDVPPSPLSYSINLVEVDEAGGNPSSSTPDRPPEPIAFHIHLTEATATDDPEVIPSTLPSPLSLSVELIEMEDSDVGSDIPSEPLSFSIDLIEPMDSITSG